MAGSVWSRAACRGRSGRRCARRCSRCNGSASTRVQVGELARLNSAEAQDVAPRLGGEAMLAGFYLNELTLRLAPRQDPAPELYDAYARARQRLGSADPLAWTLRRYERDLLDALGFGFDWHVRRRWRGDRSGRALSPRSRTRPAPRAQRPRPR